MAPHICSIIPHQLQGHAKRHETGQEECERAETVMSDGTSLIYEQWLKARNSWRGA